MCIMLTKPANVPLDYYALSDCHWRNGDGCGYTAALPTGVLVTYRSTDIKFPEFWKRLKKHNKHAMLIHFRAATSGGVCHENTHPFLLGKGSYAMAHNGVINCQRNAGESDTRAFIRIAIEPYIEKYPNIIERQKWQEYARNAVGYNNKLAFIRSDGSFFYINKQAGVEKIGCWWSNANFDVRTPSQKTIGFGAFNSSNDLADAIYEERVRRSRQQVHEDADLIPVDADDEIADRDADEYFGRLYEERCQTALEFLTEAKVMEVEDAACIVCNDICTTPYLLDIKTGVAMCIKCKNTYAKHIEPNQHLNEEDDDAGEDTQTEPADEPGGVPADVGVPGCAEGAATCTGACTGTCTGSCVQSNVDSVRLMDGDHAS